MVTITLPHNLATVALALIAMNTPYYQRLDGILTHISLNNAFG